MSELVMERIAENLSRLRLTRTQELLSAIASGAQDNGETIRKRTGAGCRRQGLWSGSRRNPHRPAGPARSNRRYAIPVPLLLDLSDIALYGLVAALVALLYDQIVYSGGVIVLGTEPIGDHLVVWLASRLSVN